VDYPANRVQLGRLFSRHAKSL